MGERTAARLLLGCLLCQTKQAEVLRDMKRVAHGRPPEHLSPARRGTLAAKQINPKRLARRRRTILDGGKRYSHCSIPDLLRRIDAGGYYKPRIPDPAIFVMGLIQVDIEIDPFGLRGNLELFVFSNVLEIRTNKNLGYIPVP
jgi:hypothetical protein